MGTTINTYLLIKTLHIFDATVLFATGFGHRVFLLVVTHQRQLYVLAGLCWLPFVWLQIRMKRLLEESVADRRLDEFACERLRRTWFLPGSPAFPALVTVFFLMVSKPTW